ncbi:uncharacterized protein LOC143605921 [Bidens hawaiensis]|uniref:uncharacterized protein LOC143605921 n=1 Tax=Bidens hawaiensis TaxID=980011 RepID=UPI004049F393
MGKFVTQDRYFFISKIVKQYLDNEQKKTNERFNKLEDELENSVFKAVSFQMGWGGGGGQEEEFENEPLDQESPDNSCYLAFDDATNLVAKGSIVDYSVSGENIEVIMQICLQGDALLLVSIEKEFIDKVKDAVGFILSWPRHLVI